MELIAMLISGSVILSIAWGIYYNLYIIPERKNKKS